VSYERAMGTTELSPVVTTTLVAEEPTPQRQEEIDRQRLERERRQQHEIDTMWETGAWRQGSMFDRWLGQRFGGRAPLGSRLLGLAFYGPRAVLSAVHCLFALAPGQSCSNYVARNKTAAVAALLWPLATGYFAWRKCENAKWAAAGVAVGVVTTPIAVWTTWLLLGAPGGFRY